VFRARVVDFAVDSLTIEITGGEEKVDRLLEVLRPYGILEMVRTGIVAMRRGTKGDEIAATAVAAASSRSNGAATIAADDNVSYSV
jgi:acetolactate synthase-1/3 small subunit